MRCRSMVLILSELVGYPRFDGKGNLGSQKGRAHRTIRAGAQQGREVGAALSQYTRSAIESETCQILQFVVPVIWILKSKEIEIL